ncbi:acyl-CoA synthetase [Amycolatopsis sp. WAC 04182]|uniref:bifunctional acetate--CoA ligase family protein/GNAT family N-acetyltransferase n=1 Tax=Amycolatopsis sp. WAC 04182 TaxID=2203198 RepID=UPI000F76B39C|nr:GNAT family N-acetyltransferase [Amycolatopsis sp. WAC 04182]RSN60939.1 acyl-CoA synthetase [Amycolatopsis sp. WAC 04182]
MTAGTSALLADGDMVTVRRLRAEDFDAVLGLHQRLDERDRYLRFFTAHPGRLDLLSRLAIEGPGIGAFRGDELIGIAHYRPWSADDAAEVALVVDHAAQAHGVGTLLLEHLVSLALAQGIHRFVALVLAENTRMIKVFSDLGLPCVIGRGGPELDVEIELGEPDRYLERIEERERLADVASLRTVLAPASVAVVGAGRRDDSVGRAILRNLLDAGYTGVAYAVNPNATEILGVPCAPSVSSLDAAVELAVICVPAESVPDVVEDCGRAGVRSIVLVTAGLTTTPLEHRVRELVARYGIRLVGPNCFGVVNSAPATRLDTTFARRAARAGRIGVVTQSGGFGIALMDALAGLGLGLSTLVSTGDKYDVSGNDLLRWWRGDGETDIAVLYLESFGNPRKFSRLARALATEKPVVAIRGASAPAAQRAAAAHTAAQPVPAATKLALFGQAGVLVVDTVTEVLGLLAALSWQPLPAGSRVVVVSNAGGAAVLGAEACVRNGLLLPELSRKTQDTLRRLLPEHASVGNPLDTSAAITADTFASCVTEVLADEGVDAVIAAGVPTGVGDPLAGLAAAPESKTVLAVRLGQLESVAAYHGIPCYADVEEAAAVMAKLSERTHWLEAGKGGLPDLSGIDLATATRLVGEYLSSHPSGGWLSRKDSEDLLACFGIRVTRRRFGDRELLVRGQSDDVFGPVVVLGRGGIDGALLDDRSTGLGPLSANDAEALIDSLRASKALFGGNSALDRSALAELLLRTDRIMELVPEVVDVDLDPVFVSAEGAAAGAVRVLVRQRPWADHYLRRL